MNAARLSADDKLHCSRPNGDRCLPECGIGLFHAPRCPVAHPEMAVAPPLPEGWGAEVLESKTHPVLMHTPTGDHCVSAGLARAQGLALIHAAAAAEARGE